MAGEVKWVATEISHGRFSVETEKYEIKVFADLSGDLVDKGSGEIIQFEDVRTLIEGAEVLRQYLTEQYGNWK